MGRNVPYCPPGRAIWDILAWGGQYGTLSASVPCCPPLLLPTPPELSAHKASTKYIGPTPPEQSVHKASTEYIGPTLPEQSAHKTYTEYIGPAPPELSAHKASTEYIGPAPPELSRNFVIALLVFFVHDKVPVYSQDFDNG